MLLQFEITCPISYEIGKEEYPSKEFEKICERLVEVDGFVFNNEHDHQDKLWDNGNQSRNDRSLQCAVAYLAQSVEIEIEKEDEHRQPYEVVNKEDGAREHLATCGCHIGEEDMECQMEYLYYYQNQYADRQRFFIE